MHQILGLDIGGANLKAVHTSGAARTVAFPLWNHPDRLSDELARLCAAMPPHERLAVTMTGELCDCFATKREGVRAILESVRQAAGRVPTCIWTNQGRFCTGDEAAAAPLRVAAANWLALAHFVAGLFPAETVLLIDTGSTTTDIVYLHHGIPEPCGLTDLDRLRSGELVYTGVRRTPICAVLGMEVAAEFFATMHDAYLYLGLTPANPLDCDTADGRPATRERSGARLARMRCGDAETFAEDEIHALAERAVQTQRQAVGGAIDRVMKGRGPAQRVVLSGSGEILGRSVGAAFAKNITSLAELFGPGLSEAACAYAVAMLAAREGGA